MARVTMLVSVGSPDPGGDPLVAGKAYNLPKEQADEFIVKGYAEGELSREIPEGERAAMRGPTQRIGVGG